MTSPLAGMRIVELSAFVAAPLCGMTLAQLGADVIRIDPIGGNMDFNRWPLAESGHSLYWAGLNKAKRSVALALHTDEGRNLAQAIIAAPGRDAGIFLTNMPEQGWNSHASLSALRPDLISMRLIGNPDGSSAVDYTVNCASGFPLLTGETAAPVNHVLPAWDIAAGLYLSTGLLAADRHRLRTGEGQAITIALADVMLATLGNLGYLADHELNDTERGPMGNKLYGAFGADFQTADGKRIMLVAISTRQWKNIVEATGLAGAFAELGSATGLDLRQEGDRYSAHDRIVSILRPWIEARSFEEVRDAFDRHRVLWGAYQDVSELMAHDPRCSTDNPLFQRLRQPGIGQYLVPGSPLGFEALRSEALRPAPLLGEDTDAVLRELVGCSARDIEELRRGHVIAGPEGVAA
jgi:2-methylfumaryl-CoA isomerase